jgi:hypothetical protein
MGIIDLQRRFVEVGRIRAGAKSAKGAPTKLSHWRLTSANRQALDAAAGIYGGEVREWAGAPNPGMYELFTESDTLRILVPPSAEPYTLWYESWSGGGCDKRCDGERDIVNDAPCSCIPDDRKCKPTLRVSVMLPDLPGLGVWRWEGHGINAALELPATLDLLAHAVSRGEFLPGFLRLEQRSTKKKGEGTRRFAVPVIDLATTLDEVSRALGAPMGTTPGIAAPAPEAERPALEAPAPEVPSDKATAAQMRRVFAVAKQHGMDKDLVSRIFGMVVNRYGASMSTMTAEESDLVVRSLERFAADVEGSTAKLAAWEQTREGTAPEEPDYGPAPPIPSA